jgi:type VI protein secretion system component VasK
MQKTVLVLLFLLTYFYSNSQLKVDKNTISRSSWQCTGVSYGDYYAYDLKKNVFTIKDLFQELIDKDAERLNQNFIETIKAKVAKEIAGKSLSLYGSGSYQINSPFFELGQFTILSPKIPVSSDKSESDVMYNMQFSNAVAVLSLTNKYKDNLLRRYDYKNGIYQEGKILKLSITNHVAGKSKKSDPIDVVYSFETTY